MDPMFVWLENFEVKFFK